jgi:Flp pilus assembly protein TadD
MALALRATVAPAALLGGCTTGPLWGKNDPSSAERLADNADPNAPGATAQWASAYAKSPQDPRMALGYSRALKAIGSRDQALQVLKASYQTNPNGEVAAELGRLALDMGRLDIAKATLQVAEAQGVRDWKTLSAQGTLRAKQGKHAEAQQYYLAALQLQPDAVSVINNLALSYALDNKADRAEELLRKAVATGHEDKRVRQNLALVLGLEGKYTEARQLAAVDLPEADAKANMAYLRNMLTKPTEMASLGAGADEVDAVPDGKGATDWKPFAANAKPPAAKPVASVAQAQPKAKAAQVASAQAPAPAATRAVPVASPAAATPSVTPKQAVAQTTAPSAPAARIATLLPAEGGSSTVAKSPPPAHAANAQVKGPELAPAASLLRTNVE